ncbi:MAG: AraC family transcriptional regulator [Anaerolinea sp.]|nr:AraC family transcriptional regulator [Anaerolinea sp.]
MINWQSLTPVYVPVLCSTHLVEHDRLFHLGPGELHRNAPQARHIHDCYEIGVITSGYGVFVVGDEEYQFETGQVFIINDLQPHMAYTADECETVGLFVVHFHPAIVTDSWITKMRSETWLPFTLDFNRSGPMIPLHDPTTPILCDLLNQIWDEAERQEHAWEIITGGLLIQAAGYLARRLLDEQETPPQYHERREALRKISPALRLVESRFAEPLTLDDMAAAAMVSRSHLCALFSTALDTSPIAYRNSRRLVEGERLLRSTDRPVHEIAYVVGFSSVQEFNRLFLRYTGMQPSQFRRSFDGAKENQKISSSCKTILSPVEERGSV